jgi:hypothetical protein
MVQMMAVPPTTEATTMRTLVAVFCIWAFFAGTPVAVEDAADTSLVSVTMFFEDDLLIVVTGPGTEGVVLGSGAIEVVAATVGTTGKVDDVVGRAAATVDVAVSELTMLFTSPTEVVAGCASVVAGIVADGVTGLLDMGWVTDGFAADVSGAGGLAEVGGTLAGGVLTAGRETKSWGARFLIRRLRLPWSRRRGSALYPLASDAVARARAIVRAKTSVRARPLRFGMNIVVMVDRRGQ